MVQMNYDAKKSKMLIVVKTCKQWKNYLKDVVYQVQMITNHCNFNNFMITKTLNRIKIKWWKKLSNFDFFIEYRFKVKNSIDDFFKKFDYEWKKKRFVTKEVTKSDHIFDSKDFILGVGYDEIVDKKSSENLSMKFVILQRKEICQFLFDSKIVNNSKNA